MAHYSSPKDEKPRTLANEGLGSCYLTSALGQVTIFTEKLQFPYVARVLHDLGSTWLTSTQLLVEYGSVIEKPFYTPTSWGHTSSGGFEEIVVDVIDKYRYQSLTTIDREIKMRFIDGGPIIPDRLLDQCSAGQVVFFCGAGVSQYPKESGVRMPSFVKLAKKVVKDVDRRSNSDIKMAIESWKPKNRQGSVPLDQIFSMLYNDYKKDVIVDKVKEILDSTNFEKSKLSHHKDILKLSENKDRVPQVVTTNFDTLFERAKKGKLTINIGPSLPNLSSGNSISGITYLHGRVENRSRGNSKSDNSNKIILSSSDFGRAYLAEGWATKFFRDLILNYTVVFLGYSANDPLVSYLLLGMENSNSKIKPNLYAFGKENSGFSRSEWKERGIELVEFLDYDDLWKTIHQWAERSRYPYRWRQKIVGLLSKDPKILEPYERGQVVEFLRTDIGINSLKKIGSAARSEWINVLDGTSQKLYVHGGSYSTEHKEKLILAYRVDGESYNENRVRREVSDRILDAGNLEDTIIGEEGREIFDRTSKSRSYEIMQWICENLNKPAMAWWVTRQSHLDYDLLNMLKQKLISVSSLNSKARLLWKLILEYHEGAPSYELMEQRQHFKRLVNRDRWKTSTLREFDKITTPQILRVQDRDSLNSFPPSGGWTRVCAREVATIDVMFPDVYDKDIKIPERVLKDVAMIIQNNLLQAARVMDEVYCLYGKRELTGTCYNSRNIKGNIEYRRFGKEISLFVDLFDRLIKFDKCFARVIADGWQVSEYYFFRKLKFYALNCNSLYTGSDVADHIVDLNDAEFWCQNSGREMLFLIRDRWHEFSLEEREAIASRIVSTPTNLLSSSESESVSRAKSVAAVYGRWLASSGCEFPDMQKLELQSIIGSLDNWNDAWARAAVEIENPISVIIHLDEAPEAMDSLPSYEDVDREIRKEDADMRISNLSRKSDFTILVERDIEKAIRLLDTKLLSDQELSRNWNVLLSKWPANPSNDLYRSFMKLLVTLEADIVCQIGGRLGDHLRDEFHIMVSIDPDSAWDLIDHVISSWISEDDGRYFDADNAMRNRGSREFSKMRHAHAINRPIGKITQAFIRLIDNREVGIPQRVEKRLNVLLKSPTYHKGQCVAILAECINWLYQIDSDWVIDKLIPLFEFQSDVSESAWSGFIFAPNPFHPEVFRLLEYKMVNLFPWVYDFLWDGECFRKCVFFVISTGTIYSKISSKSYEKEIRKCLRSMNIESLRDSIYWLRRIGGGNENGWTDIVVPFLESVWPNEMSFHSSELTRSWALLLADTGDSFPEVYSAIKNFLMPMKDGGTFLRHYCNRRQNQIPLARRFPSDMLDFVDSIVPEKCDFVVVDLRMVLDVIKAADGSLERDLRYIRLSALAEGMPSFRSRRA